MKQYSIFAQRNWFFRHYDGRRKEFEGISRDAFKRCCATHLDRMQRNLSIQFDSDTFSNPQRREMIKYFAAIPYEYEGDYMDDYSKYQRPASNGVGYVAICPGERANNIYVEDKLLVAYLTKKYEKYLAAKASA